MAKRYDYEQEFFRLLSDPATVTEFDEICNDLNLVGSKTVKDKLREFLSSNPEYVTRVAGMYPSPETVIEMAVQQLGEVCGENIQQINEACRDTISKITKPRHLKFLKDSFVQRFSIREDMLSAPLSDIVDFLYSDYVDFVHESDNGLVSIAGGMNEKILFRGLVHAGLKFGEDFKKTGTGSEGDIQIEHRSDRITRILVAEVKSYAARERLLRGLRDIPSETKIGVGFFTNPNEFNPARTQTLLAARPMSIYMPNTTYDKLHPDSSNQVTSTQDKLYRPLSRFFTDMFYFKQHGTLPMFR